MFAGNCRTSTDSSPKCSGNGPLLAAAKSEMRNYEAVFFLGKSEIGLESNVVGIPVAGWHDLNNFKTTLYKQN
jgi:hypothetical protein